MSLYRDFVDACASGDLDKAKALHKQGADIHACDELALRWAVRLGHLDVVKYLVEHGADIHVGNDHALRRAAECGHLDVVNFLKEAAAGVVAEKPIETGKKLTVKVRKFPRVGK